MYNFWDSASLSFSGSDDLSSCSWARPYLLSIPKKAVHSNFSQSNRIAVPLYWSTAETWKDQPHVNVLAISRWVTRGFSLWNRQIRAFSASVSGFFRWVPGAATGFGRTDDIYAGLEGLEIDFLLFALGYPQLRIENANMKGKRSCSLIQKLWLWAESATMHVEMTYSGVFDSNDLLCFDLCNHPSPKAVFRD